MGRAQPAKLGTIMIRCPVTRQLVSTGFTGHRSAWEHLPTRSQGGFLCPECDQIHVWSSKQAFFVEPA